MAAITCEACGGNSLTMTDDGQFSVCDFCGTKHTLEKIRAKAQQIKGVVEVNKGEAEKERLLNNAETCLTLNDVDKAKGLFKQLTYDFPDDYRGWLGLFKIPLLYCENPTIEKLLECYDIENKIKILSKENLTSNIWDIFLKSHSLKVISSRKNGPDITYSVIDTFSANLLMYNTKLLPKELADLQRNIGNIYKEKFFNGELLSFPFSILDKYFINTTPHAWNLWLDSRQEYNPTEYCIRNSEVLWPIYLEGRKMADKIASLDWNRKKTVLEKFGVPSSDKMVFLCGKTIVYRDCVDTYYVREAGIPITEKVLDDIINGIN